MRPLAELPAETGHGIRFVLTDIDDTLTYRGRLAAETFAALERLSEAGITVVPTTAAPAGWCDMIVRMWPVDGIIGENGGFYFRRGETDGGVQRRFWLAPAERARHMGQLARIASGIVDTVPGAAIASDQAFRQTTSAIEPAGQGIERSCAIDGIAAAWRAAGARVTVNSLWVLGWFGDFDKLQMTRRMMAEVYSIDIDNNREDVIYVGDSLNDEPMFRHFPNSIGVATVADYLDRLAHPPRWITRGSGGAGFVEIANAILVSRRGRERQSRA